MNAIVNQKEKTCSQDGIDFSVSVFLPSEVKISDTDLCRSLVNILDNAIEAVQTNIDKKTVSLNISAIDEYIYIKAENSYDGQSFDTSTKKDNKSDHGFGLKILRDVADKYNGSFSLEPKDDKVLQQFIRKYQVKDRALIVLIFPSKRANMYLPNQRRIIL